MIIYLILGVILFIVSFGYYQERRLVDFLYDELEEQDRVIRKQRRKIKIEQTAKSNARKSRENYKQERDNLKKELEEATVLLNKAYLLVTDIKVKKEIDDFIFKK